MVKRVALKLYCKIKPAASQNFILATWGSELETSPSSFLLYNISVLTDVYFLTFFLKSPAKPFFAE